MYDWSLKSTKQIQKELEGLIGSCPYPNTNPKLTFRDERERKEVTKCIDYGCELCAHKNSQAKRAKFRCCTNCASNFGYQGESVMNLQKIKLLMRSYDKKLGFWREGKGCILPREYRSITCLAFGCYLRESMRSDLREYLHGKDVPVQLSLPLNKAWQHTPCDLVSKLDYEGKRNVSMYWQEALS